MRVDGQRMWLDLAVNGLPANLRVFDASEVARGKDLERSCEAALRTPSIELNDTLAPLRVSYAAGP